MELVRGGDLGGDGLSVTARREGSWMPITTAPETIAAVLGTESRPGVGCRGLQKTLLSLRTEPGR